MPWRSGAALALALVALPVLACPPPPPPLPTPQQQAARFRADADALCLVRLRGDVAASSSLPELRRWALAEGYWQVEAVALQTLKGECTAGVVHYAEVPPALCGGGLPPYDVDLLVAMTPQRVLTRWTLSDSELGAALLGAGAVPGQRRP